MDDFVAVQEVQSARHLYGHPLAPVTHLAEESSRDHPQCKQSKAALLHQKGATHCPSFLQTTGFPKRVTRMHCKGVPHLSLNGNGPPTANWCRPKEAAFVVLQHTSLPLRAHHAAHLLYHPSSRVSPP